MAGSQSAAPKGVKPSSVKKRFTVEQANRTLPLVKRVVSDIVRTHGLVSTLHGQLEEATAASEQQGLQAELEREVDRLHEYVEELSVIGCELKDYQTGLVDFVGKHKGRDVCLCWKLGEDKVEYWHEMQTGFAGRQPVATLDEK